MKLDAGLLEQKLECGLAFHGQLICIAVMPVRLVPNTGHSYCGTQVQHNSFGFHSEIPLGRLCIFPV